MIAFYSICLHTYNIYNKPNTPQPVSRPSLSSPAISVAPCRELPAWVWVGGGQGSVENEKEWEAEFVPNAPNAIDALSV